MKTIGIVGVGFVGNAVREGLRHAFSIYSFDRKDRYPSEADKYWIRECVKNTDIVGTGILVVEESEVYEKLIGYVDGPIFICVPTPMKNTGQCDTAIVEKIVKDLDAAAQKLNRNIITVIKSTVPPGTTEKLNDSCSNSHVCFNPEFLTEMNAVKDFKNQDRIIIGGPREGTDILKQMYESSYPNVPVTKTSSTIAEMVKYTTNCFLAVKVSFANELKQICDKLQIDMDKVVEYATKDKRLGTSHWAVPGPMPSSDGSGKLLPGYSGSCFVKDINALMFLARELGVDPKVMMGSWMKNLEVRPEKDWEFLVGRAIN